MRNFFTSDTHFNDEAIFKLLDRPFESIHTMNHELIVRWNSKVSIDDNIFILGDFGLSKQANKEVYAALLSQLHGRKHLILGNHEEQTMNFYRQVGYFSIHYPYMNFRDKYYLVHDPALSVTDRSRIFLCGHIHDLFDVAKNCINVSTDVWDYTPVSEQTIDLLIEKGLELAPAKEAKNT